MLQAVGTKGERERNWDGREERGERERERERERKSGRGERRESKHIHVFLVRHIHCLCQVHRSLTVSWLSVHHTYCNNHVRRCAYKCYIVCLLTGNETITVKGWKLSTTAVKSLLMFDTLGATERYTRREKERKVCELNINMNCSHNMHIHVHVHVHRRPHKHIYSVANGT